MSVKKITLLGLYTAMALIVFMVESALPALTPLPFIRLGLSNIVTLLVLALVSPKDACTVLLLRIFLTSVFAGQLVYFMYSLAGGVVCFLGEWMINQMLKGKYLVVVSMFGAICHNLGQFFVAVLFLGTGVLMYLPYMMIAGIFTGFFTGICVQTLVKRLKKMNF